MARRHAEVFLDVIEGKASRNPTPPDVPQPARSAAPGAVLGGPARPHLVGAASNATAEWAAKMGMSLQSSTLKVDENGKPFHVQQAEQIRAYRAAWKDAGHTREGRVSVSRSIFALVNDQDRMYFGRQGGQDQFGVIDQYRAVFGRSYADEPDRLIEQLRQDEAIAEADTLLLTVPNQLGVDYNAHLIESILTHVAPGLGWR